MPTIELDDRTALLLKIVADEFIREGGPVWNTAQDWSEEFKPEELDRLADSIDATVAQVLPPQPKP